MGEVLPESGEGHVDELDPVALPLVPPGHGHSRDPTQGGRRGVPRGVGQAAAQGAQVLAEAQSQLLHAVLVVVSRRSGEAAAEGEVEVEVEVRVAAVGDGVVVEIQPPLAVGG